MGSARSRFAQSGAGRARRRTAASRTCPPSAVPEELPAEHVPPKNSYQCVFGREKYRRTPPKRAGGARQILIRKTTGMRSGRPRDAPAAPPTWAERGGGAEGSRRSFYELQVRRYVFSRTYSLETLYEMFATSSASYVLRILLDEMIQRGEIQGHLKIL